VTDARVARVPADHVVRCIRESPDIALAMIASTSQHLHHLVQQVEQLKAQSGVQRVAEFLASLAPDQQGPCTIKLPYDKVLIAARLGLTPESLSRAFARLRSVGVMIDASHVSVRDVEKLRQLAADDRSAVRGTLRLVR
jgi:CRP-like cAMP-binding protein